MKVYQFYLLPKYERQDYDYGGTVALNSYRGVDGRQDQRINCRREIKSVGTSG